MNKVKQVYQVVDAISQHVEDEFKTRSEAREYFRELGGAANQYTLKQITTVVVEQKIR